MYYTNQRRNKRNHAYYNPLENILNEMMNVPIKQFVKPNEASFTFPAANILELEDKFSIQIMLPGISKKDIDIKIQNNELIVSRIKNEEASNKEEIDFKLKEFDYSEFERKFKLPTNILTSKIKASFTKGILTINLSKDPDASRTIKVG